MSSLIFSSSLTCEFLPKMKKMKMPITKIFCCVLLICGLAVFTTESPANPEFTPNWFPGERWSYPFDGYQIDSTPMQHTFGVSVMSDVDKEKSTSLTSIPMASEPSKTKTEVSEMKNNVKEGEPSEPYDSIAEEPVKRPSDGSTRGSTYDPTLIMMGLGKRINTFYPEHKSVGIHEHEFTDNPLAQKVFLRLRRSTDTGIGEQEGNRISGARSSAKNERTTPLSFSNKGIDVYRDFSVEETEKEYLAPKSEENEISSTSFSKKIKRSATHSVLERVTNGQKDFALQQKKNIGMLLKHKGNENVDIKSSERLKRSAVHSMLDKEANDFESTLSGKIKNSDINLKQEGIKSLPNGSGEKKLSEDNNAKRNKRSLHSNKEYESNKMENYKTKTQAPIKKDTVYDNSNKVHSKTPFEDADREKRNVRQSTKKFAYDPALKYMGLGKRQKFRRGFSSNYDPAFQYMGLGKRNNDLGSRKRESYDPALQFMGLGKRENVSPKSKLYLPVRKMSKRASYDPAFYYMGSGKKNFPKLNFKKASYDPALQYMGLGKRENVDIYDNDKKKSYDPAFKYMGLGKRDNDSIKKSYDPAFQYMGLGKRENVDSYENDKNKSYDPAFQYMGLGKKENVDIYDNDKKKSYDPAFKYMGLGKRDNDSIKKSYDPAFQYMGLGKRENVDSYENDKNKSYDPAFQYMGLGKKENVDIYDNEKKKSYDPAI
ncbi:hypothetical protein JTE90_016822 [Oedothorax gibbosus]|uniref:Uncharacterized protein n=1 Tax=Oedothorax gibbosus TaxID=931172 RepID=A0AAV6VXG1_9ARAC|nr:hypothetical protein JTE90_016822 [Oedothorax gibbosus]